MGLTEYSRKPFKLFWTIVATMMIPGLCVIDYLVSGDVALLIFYLIPIFIFTWFTGWWYGIIMSFLSAASWLTIDIISTQGRINSNRDYLDASIQLGFFFITVSVLSILKTTMEREKNLARIDPLTGVANWRNFLEQIEVELSKVNRYHSPISLAYLDLDNFKGINDMLGHGVGNTTLRMVAETIKRNIRLSDTIARLGGDEFAIILPQTDNQQALLIINKLQKTLLEEMRKNRWAVTFSIGLITYLIPPNSADEMLKKVDGLMYLAKDSGKNMIKQSVVTDTQ